MVLNTIPQIQRAITELIARVQALESAKPVEVKPVESVSEPVIRRGRPRKEETAEE